MPFPETFQKELLNCKIKHLLFHKYSPKDINRVLRTFNGVLERSCSQSRNFWLSGQEKSSPWPHSAKSIKHFLSYGEYLSHGIYYWRFWDILQVSVWLRVQCASWCFASNFGWCEKGIFRSWRIHKEGTLCLVHTVNRNTPRILWTVIRRVANTTSTLIPIFYTIFMALINLPLPSTDSCLQASTQFRPLTRLPTEGNCTGRCTSSVLMCLRNRIEPPCLVYLWHLFIVSHCVGNKRNEIQSSVQLLCYRDECRGLKWNAAHHPQKSSHYLTTVGCLKRLLNTVVKCIKHSSPLYWVFNPIQSFSK